jgi:large subunit ribosomal protein L4
MSNKTVDVLDVQGKKAGQAELPESLFDVQTNIPLIHQVVVAQLAAARQGTASTKTRGEVRGGGIKPWRQKGTGRARQGSRRAPQWAGGGVVHGPHPRDYSQRTPKKMVAAALRGALSDRARDGQVFVIKEIVSGETPSTKAALASLAAFGDLTKVLVVLDRFEDVAWLSLRNIATVHALAVDQLNTYDVLVNDKVVFTEAALAAFVAGPATGKSVKAVATESEAAAEKPLKAVPKAEAEVAADDVSAEGAYHGDNPPAGFDIKGSKGSGKYHTPDSPWYARTKAEVWFNSAEAAEAAGYVPAVANNSEEKDK